MQHALQKKKIYFFIHKAFFSPITGNSVNIQILQKEKKEAIAAMLLSSFTASTPLSIKKSFQEIIDYMFAKDQSKLWPKFLQQTQQLDELREETMTLF